MDKIRVMIVDDHDVVRRSLGVLIQAFDTLELVGEAADGNEALALVPQLRPDVILMDIVMPGMDGLTATRVLRQKHPQVKVLALTSFAKDETVASLLEAGAVGCLPKNTSVDELVAGVRAAFTS
jgi:NarL family two-component system response regulator LiaR